MSTYSIEQLIRVWYRTRPGPFEQYDGYVDVLAYNRRDAEAKAFAKLRIAHPNKGRDMWKIEKVEPLR